MYRIRYFINYLSCQSISYHVNPVPLPVALQCLKADSAVAVNGQASHPCRPERLWNPGSYRPSRIPKRKYNGLIVELLKGPTSPDRVTAVLTAEVLIATREILPPISSQAQAASRYDRPARQLHT